MQFSILKIAVATLAVCTDLALAQTLVASPAQVASSLQMLADKTQSLQGPALALDVFQGAGLLFGQGKLVPVVAGIAELTSMASTLQSQWNNVQVTEAADVDNIANAFRDLVRQQQTFLNTLSSKAGLASTFPLIGGPMSTALQQLNSVLGALGFSTLSMVSSRATDLQSQITTLNQAMDRAIAAYSGINLANKKRSISRRDAFRASIRA
ncbi:hypothetical protein MCOR25_007216 [Pyricularia grisea]|uniref:Uncharacterized protein n=1 Tax=Pyricularia grisea TaxID=148305 RepID=A0A6P8B0M1_PYRGI|nr:uncharacterized protein PgNI_07175 [Pyricularia grisea]KAI6358953.1 hypothetical protein MCOR25_007216 [Pyricularia grisea]TLD08376.1 hypothetical protein PgNI_07175 [Pyricularia grisea]